MEAFTADLFDKISPVAISEGKFRDHDGFFARRIEEIECSADASAPCDFESVRFEFPPDRALQAPGGHENYCSRLSVGLHGFQPMPPPLR